MITNDDGIDAPGLRALVTALVATNLYNIQVCAPDSYVTIHFHTNIYNAGFTNYFKIGSFSVRNQPLVTVLLGFILLLPRKFTLMEPRPMQFLVCFYMLWKLECTYCLHALNHKCGCLFHPWTSRARAREGVGGVSRHRVWFPALS